MPGPSYALLATKAAEFVCDVVARQMQQPQPVTINITDPSLGILQEVVDSFQNGKSILHLKDALMQLTTNQEQRAELISALVLSHDYSRLTKYIAVREHLEDKVLEAALRDDLSPAEQLMLLRLVGDETTALENKVQGSSTGIKDMMALMNKVDYQLQVGEHSLRTKYAKTTPQGREIVRRIAVRIQQTFRNEN